MRVASPSTPAQYHHVLLRQMEGKVRKPLIVMAPKSLLRHPQCVSSLEEMASGSFQTVLDDPLFAEDPASAGRVLIGSGKVLYDVLAAREKSGRKEVAVVRLEQLYPFPGEALGRVLARYPSSAEVAFLQEEPRNMGAWRFFREQWLDGKVAGVSPDRPLRYVGRRELASPAPGSHRVFHHEQETLVGSGLTI